MSVVCYSLRFLCVLLLFLLSGGLCSVVVSVFCYLSVCSLLLLPFLSLLTDDLLFPCFLLSKSQCTVNFSLLSVLCYPLPITYSVTLPLFSVVLLVRVFCYSLPSSGRSIIILITLSVFPIYMQMTPLSISTRYLPDVLRNGNSDGLAAWLYKKGLLLDLLFINVWITHTRQGHQVTTSMCTIKFMYTRRQY